MSTNDLSDSDYKLLGERLGYKYIETDYDTGGYHWESPEGVDMCDFGPDVFEIENFVKIWNSAFMELIESQKRDTVGFLAEDQIDLLDMAYNLSPVFIVEERIPILIEVVKYLQNETKGKAN